MLTIKTPETYINKPDITKDAGKYIKEYGRKAYIISSKTPLQVVEDDFFESLERYGIEYAVEEFKGYPTMKTIDRYAAKAFEYGAALILGLGGGKVNDTAKAVGSKTKLPVIAVPTIAATCAAWAACSILYKSDGDFDTIYQNEYTPRLILADTRLLATAPARYMNAGIVDTLAKWIETIPNQAIAPDNITLNLSISGAKLAYDILQKEGQKVVEDGQKNIITDAAIAVIDAIIYLAGFVGSFAQERFYGGFAHPFYYATTRLPHTRHKLHGEKVALGLLIQLTLENKPEAYIKEMIREFERYQLALTLEDIGIKEHREEDLHTISTNILKDFPGYTQLGYGTAASEIEAAILKTDNVIRQTRNS